MNQMSKTDELFFELGGTLVRGISLHDWPEKLDITTCSNKLVSAIDTLSLWPANAGISKDIMKRYAARKWRSANEVDLSEFEFIELLSVNTSKRLTTTNFNQHLSSFSVSLVTRGEIYFEHTPEILSIETGIRVISEWLSVTTPQYGFSTIQPKGTSALFHGGQPNPNDDEAYTMRIRAHEQARYCEPHESDFLGKRLLDVFEMNILSPAHITGRVFGTTLGDWISKGDRGQLRQLKKDVHAWIVPDDIRPDIRQKLLRAKHLVVPV
jgi:hypothetical protein